MGATRKSNWELLRILSMLAIVYGHLFWYGEGVDCLRGADALVASLLGNGSRLACNVFLMIGVWFMVDAKFSARRILSLYAQVLLYSIPLTVLVLCLGCPVPIKEILRGFFPFWGRGLWFASAYMILLFWAPFLKRAFQLPKRQLELLLLTLLLFTSCVCTLPDPQMSYALDLYWFACIYLFIGYVKHRTDWCDRARPILCLVGGMSIYAVLATAYWVGAEHDGFVFKAMHEVANQWLLDFKTVPNLLAAFLIFLGFSRFATFESRLVNLCAKGVFGVYVLHSVPSFNLFLINGIVGVPRWIQAPHVHLWALLSAIGIFAVCSVVDALRRKLLEPFYANSRLFSWICRKVDGLYAGVETN